MGACFTSQNSENKYQTSASFHFEDFDFSPVIDAGKSYTPSSRNSNGLPKPLIRRSSE